MQGKLGAPSKGEPQGDIWAMSCVQPEAREGSSQHFFSLLCGEYCHSSSPLRFLPAPAGGGAASPHRCKGHHQGGRVWSQRGQKSSPGFSVLLASQELSGSGGWDVATCSFPASGLPQAQGRGPHTPLLLRLPLLAGWVPP